MPFQVTPFQTNRIPLPEHPEYTGDRLFNHDSVSGMEYKSFAFPKKVFMTRKELVFTHNSWGVYTGLYISSYSGFCVLGQPINRFGSDSFRPQRSASPALMPLFFDRKTCKSCSLRHLHGQTESLHRSYKAWIS